MRSSHIQTEICIEGAFKRSKMVSARTLMIIIIIAICYKKFRKEKGFCVKGESRMLLIISSSSRRADVRSAASSRSIEDRQKGPCPSYRRKSRRNRRTSWDRLSNIIKIISIGNNGVRWSGWFIQHIIIYYSKDIVISIDSGARASLIGL